ncbi:MAG: complex I NDUFA9 subunit family protein [Betaproteobacteria bacterium]|nr:complex I NDUFA9 subunit family protein [Betaproteobacteria bacterium]
MIDNILVLGGGGFIGRHVVSALAARGRRVSVPSRHRERDKHLVLLPTVEVLEADINDQLSLRQLVAGRGAVINLVGILHSPRGRPDERGPNDYAPGFAQAHVELPQSIVSACREHGVRRVLHMSALGARRDATSEYLRSKGIGEEAVLAAAEIDASVFRPSVVFGAEDRFLNLFSRLAGITPVLALACAEARFQPVYVGDVANAFVIALDERNSFGKRYDLCGPTVYTLRQLVEYVCRVTGRRRLVAGLPDSLGYLQALILEQLPGPLMSRDNLLSMQMPSVSEQPLPFGIVATPMEAIAPRYLLRGGPRAHYGAYRDRARR